MKSPGGRLVTLPSHPLALGALAFVSYAALVELFYVVFDLADLAGNPDPVATFFPPAGLSVALFLGSRYSRWPVLVVAIWAAEVTVDLLHGVGFWDGALFGVTNTVEPMVAAVLIRRFILPEDRRNLGSMRNLMVFLGSAVVAGPAVGALIASMAGLADDLAAFTGLWTRYWVGDGIGVLVVAPVLLVFSDRRQAGRSWSAPLLGLVTLAAAITLGPVQPVHRGTLAYLLLPVLIWVAFRGGPPTTAAAVLIVGLTANLTTVLGYGPFVEPGSPFTGLLNAQIFIGTLAFSALTVAVLGANLIRRDEAEMLQRKQVEEAQASFLGTLAHDFRTPITAVKGFAELVRDAPEEKRDEFLQRIDANADRLIQMMTDLVNYATAQGVSTTNQTETLDLEGLVRETVPTMGAASELARVVLPQGQTLVVANKAALERVVINLVGNALKYSTTGPVVVDAVRAEDLVRLSVADQGRGVASEDLDRIFNEFERGVRATEDGGTGLGLSSVKRLVEGQGGSVHLESAVGQGTKVTVELPAPTSGNAPALPAPKASLFDAASR